MKTVLLVALVLSVSGFGQNNPPRIPFTSVPDYPNLPDGMNLGEVSGVAVNSKKHVFVFTRANSANGPAFGAAAAQLLEFDENGNYVREIGKGLYAWSEAHTVRIDREDNIWAIDKGSNMVIKFNPRGRVVSVFGRKDEAADGAGPLGHPDPPLPAVDGLFRQPTDVAWDSKNNIYISDGYVNSRIAKYDQDGEWVKSWGTKGSGQGQFNLPHSIAIDSQDNIYVGDRSNARVQVFDTEGNFKRMFSVKIPPDPNLHPVYGAVPKGENLERAIGAPNSLCIPPGSNIIFLGELAYPGRIFKLTLDGKVLGVIGGAGRKLGRFGGAHQLACPSENEIYVAETATWRVQKLLLH